MPMNKRSLALTGIIAAMAALFVVAQEARQDDSAGGSSGGGTPHHFGIKADDFPRDPRQWRGGQFADFPTWPVSKELPNDLFTFARVRYDSGGYGGGYGRYRRHSSWLTDYPDGEMNLAYRLQQLTSMQVNPNGVLVDIEADQLRHYPFIYIVEPGAISLSDEQGKTLRDYLLNGGFLMVDDFWGVEEWEGFYQGAFKKIWPDREFEEIPVEHEIFHNVFPLKVKPQIPGVGFGTAGRAQGITYEWNKPGSETVHYRGVYDDKRRLMMIICWNTDYGDGWEEEGTDPWYFREFSEKYAYPFTINLLFYVMTH